ncbi:MULTISPECIES: hypothetical protein [Romboutsia]|uniref:Alpha-glucosidase n=1 Tax=Romboutsia hominis TaxID=1507512 RepID=A0A2P2BMK9_9FIRM|nr:MULTISPECIES: hypothetical protein [Romboutsia]MCH1958665.1 hypothetical protein [Romboutsia hominis]MCH1970581.1 hypothetical protein [Romboutsia hominis]MDB8789276.1 hypothetical protein [Romboutsia sp. 1001216sp1]MDB8793278.1 hypothetical protein [Romboutsia sp. 1001216sp1]MDB8796070.1 hypothetical protein [Romboutsia sp. 1001216sp1]
MGGKLVMTTINQIRIEVEKSKRIKDNKKEKYIKQLKTLYTKYEDIEINENFKKQYQQLNSKGTELLKEIKGSKDENKIEGSIEVYIRYLKASLCDFEGKTSYLRKYITSFLFSSILFLALSPQFYGFILPVIFFLPIYMGLKGVKQRTMTGFYMTMSVVPVAIMTSFTWIRYGINAKADYTGAVKAIVDSGVAERLAEKLVYIGPIFGFILLLFACLQMYRGYKSRDLFI